MQIRYFFIAMLLFIFNSSIALADANKIKQVELDNACEAARQMALKPIKDEIIHECLTKFKKDYLVCKQEADSYNGNRIHGAPMFYELPACEKAFQFKKDTTNQ